MLYRQEFILGPEKPQKKWGGTPALCLKAIMSLTMSHTLSLIFLELFSLSKIIFLCMNLLMLALIFYKMTQAKFLKSVAWFGFFLIIIFALNYYISYAPEII